MDSGRSFINAKNSNIQGPCPVEHPRVRLPQRILCLPVRLVYKDDEGVLPICWYFTGI